MSRDPIYNPILQALAGPLFPELFERAAVALLRLDYRLVPVRGGQDGGINGGEGSDISLICADVTAR